MSDGMIGAVGAAMQADRLARAASNLKVMEAARANEGQVVLARIGVGVRRAKAMTVRTVAGIPVAVGADAGTQGMSGAIRLVRNPAG